MHQAMLLCVLCYSNLAVAEGMEQALQALTAQTAATAEQIHQMAQIVSTATSSSSNTQEGMATLFNQWAQEGAQRERMLATLKEISEQSISGFKESQESVATQLRAAVKESRNIGEVELHKLVKAPDVFAPTSWQEEKNNFAEFKHRLRTWLGSLDSRIVAALDVVERAPHEPLNMADMTEAGKETSRRIYSIMSSYTKNRPQRVVHAVKDQNGMEAYRQLLYFNQPNTKARALQLQRELQAFRFDKDKTYNENLLKYEEMIEEYEKASKERTSDAFKIGTIIDSVPNNVRQHILLNMKEDTTYDHLRSFLTTYENSRRWTQPTTTDLINAGKDHGGQAAMDVSRVDKGGYKGWYKGRGKDKGKDGGKKGYKGDKGGKGKWSKGGRKGNWKGRGKGKSGYKGRGSWKGRGKGSKGKDSYTSGKGSGQGVCHYCHKPGHYEAQCRQKQRNMGNGVRNVNNNSQSEMPTSASATESTITGTTSSGTSTQRSQSSNHKVRQVTLFHMGDEPMESSPQLFKIDSKEEDEYKITYFNNIMRVEHEMEVFAMNQDESNNKQEEGKEGKMIHFINCAQLMKSYRLMR